MGTEKRQRQKEGRQARIAAAEAAQARSNRRRRYITFAVMAIVVLGLFGLLNLLTSKSKSKSVSAAGTTTSTAPASSTTTLASAKGKNCVAMKGTRPKGAPSVPVTVGPPPTNLVVKDLKVGTGPAVTVNDTITANYIGVACSTGAIFDSSWSRNQPITTPLNGVIKGWTQGLVGMKAGGSRLLGIPSSLGYGSQQAGPDIAPDESLWFVVDLISITKGTTSSSSASSSTTASTTSTTAAVTTTTK